MATTFKPITTNDVSTTKTLLYEAIPMSGTIFSGTYSDNNVKNYSHGMFQSVYDYPYLSSSANHIMDLTVGYSANSALSKSASKQNDKKINIYNQMAQILMGYDVTGSVLEFDRNMDKSLSGTKMKECIFINYARLLTKDEIKKESYALTFHTGGTVQARSVEKLIKDYGATTTFKNNTPAGEVGILYSGSDAVEDTGVGLVFYQAGIVVLTASIFTTQFGFPGSGEDTASINTLLTGANISASCDGIRNAWYDNLFNNTTELNSAIYFARVNHNEFNYSSNPTYLSASTIRVKNEKSDSPLSYITTVGLYSTDNVLMAVAKLSEPLKKDPSNEFTLRVRLDY